MRKNHGLIKSVHKFKSLCLLSAMPIGVLATPFFMSCGQEGVQQDNTEVYRNKRGPNLDLIIERAKFGPTKMRSDFLDNTPKPVVIPDAGIIFDNSFYETHFSAAKLLAQNYDGVELHNPFVRSDSNRLEDLYYAAIKAGYRVLIMPGILHQEEWPKFWKKHSKDLQLESRGIIAIGMDLDWSHSDLPPGTAVSIQFDAHLNSFITGYAAAKYLANKHDNLSERVLSTFAGMPIRGLVDFIYGTFTALKWWNEHNERKVKLNSDTVLLDAYFDPASPSAITAVEHALAGNSKIVIPASTSNIQRLVIDRDTSREAKIIGVSYDETQVYPDIADNVFASSIRNISGVAYRVLDEIYSGVPTLLTPEFLSGRENVYLRVGFEGGYISIAPSKLQGISDEINQYIQEGHSALKEMLVDPEYQKMFNNYLEAINSLDSGKRKLRQYLNNFAAEINKLADNDK